MDDQKQLFVFAQPLPGNDQSLLERVKTAASSRNRYGAVTTYALSEIEANNIIQMVVGPSHIAFLFKNGRVARLGYHLTVNKDESGAGTGGGGGSSGTDDKSSSGSGAVGLGAAANSSGTSTAGSESATNTSSANSALNRTAKIRRVMLTSRRSATLGERAGVIVDRTRPLVPLSAIPEDLIAQAQVVLQGKSRDVIVRELQRTNLNVNEAVNNLLSRDDEDGDEMDEGSESYLPEELLSLLDAGLRSDVRGTAVIDHDAFYAATGNGFDYVVARDIARRKADRGEKKNDKSKEPTSDGTNAVIKVYDRLQYWNDDDDKLPYGVTKFTKIVSMHSELIALADDGFIYGWSWKSSNGTVAQHPFAKAILANGFNGEKIVDIVTCAYRACILTSANRVASFMDAGACGKRVSKLLMMPLSDVPDGEKAVALYACPMFSLVRTLNNNFYWWGIYPFNERRKLWERVRSRSRRHVTFDVSEITEGCEVRTKSHPIYMAGSIAISFVSGVPMIGTLMESAWTLAELCRFRVQTPSQYDESSTREKHSENGKRPREESVTPTFRETAWALNDVIFIHEENSQDTAIVKIVDGAYCGIVYKSASDANSKLDAGGTNQLVELAKIRLMRKDDLVIVSPSNRTSRSPDNFQMHLTKIQLPNWLSARKLHSVTVDNTGVRMLVEKRGRMHLIRVSVFGKLLTDHLLPMNSVALSGVPQLTPQLINYGDESLTVIRDGNGSIIPMCRDAVGGFREPVYLGFASIRHSAIGLRPIEQGSDATSFGMSTPSNAATGSSRQSNRTAIIAALIAPSPTSVHPAIPSLIQTILYCDSKAVECVLDALRKESVDVIMSEVVYARCDGNRNVIHTAVMNAFSLTNRDDEDTDDASTQQQVEMNAAEQTRASYDQRWQRILRRRGTEPSNEQLLLRELMNPIRRSGHEVSSVEDVLADIAKSFEDSKKQPPLFFDDNSMPILATPVSEPKQRQTNAIEIVKTLCRHPTTVTYLHDLLTTKDIHGHTPFMCAINVRAYSAAYFIWTAIENLHKEVLTTTTLQSGKKAVNADSIINATVFPVGSKPDDSPLFVLCVNDTCSFTWTGDEHINQDIFECKTCGLIGTLCCCTECAFTCHRNHDCKLKRTSPTAYCDCWEKCSCKALVVGNRARREKLLETLLHGTDLINQVNARGEHLMLFLARTVGRQLVEQEHYQRRGNSNKPKTQPSSDGVTPEHDLEPPKFARTAFMKLLTDWRSVKSVIMIGVKKQQKDTLMLEEVYQLNQQSGTSHLDKFVFTLLAKCTESHIDSLLNTLITESNKKDSDEEKRDPDVDFIIARFIRSVIRLFAILTLLSPVAAGVAAAATSGTVFAPIINNGAPQRRSLASGFHAVSFSGLLSLVRTSSGRDSSAVKQAKKKSVTNFVLKCRRVFQTLICYSINELCNMADALIAPVRRGILKPTALVQQTNSSVDCLEMIEHYLAGEVDLSSLSTSRFDDFTSSKPASKRRRQSSRRDTDRQVDDESHSSTTASTGGGTLSALINVVDSDNSSDYESDDVASARHPVSQGSSVDAVDDEQRPKRYRGDYEDEELLSMSGDEDEDEGEDGGDDDDESMDDSVSTPPERGDDENEDGEETDGDAARDGMGSGRAERDRDDDEEEDIFNVADEEEREEDGEEADGDAERQPDAFSASNQDPYAFRVSTRSQRRNSRSASRSSNVTMSNAPSNANEPSSNNERDNSLSNTDTANGSSRTRGEGSSDTSGHDSATDVARSDATTGSNNNNEANTDRSAEVSEDDRGSGDGDTSRQSAMRVLFTTDSGGDSGTTRSRAASRRAAMRRNATLEDMHIAAPPTPPSERDASSARTSGVTSGRNNNENDHHRRFVNSNSPSNGRSNTNNSSAAAASSQHLGDAINGEDDCQSSVNKTSQQLAMSFSIITRLVVDLMPLLVDYREYSKSSYSHIPKMLELNDVIVAALRHEVGERFNATWRWMESVLDRTEAQLRFGNALMWSPAGAMIVNDDRKSSSSRKDDVRRRAPAIYSAALRADYTTARQLPRGESSSKKSEEESYQMVARSDLFGYILALMRSNAAENGDDVPIIEFNALKALAFVADAYLSFVDMIEKVDFTLEQMHSDDGDASASSNQTVDMFEDQPMRECEPTTSASPKAERHFFQRSNSLLYPGITAARNHHAFEHKCSDCLTLAEQPQLLRAGLEKEHMFGLPVEQRSAQDHERCAREHGVEHPAHQGLAAPWSSFKELMPSQTQSGSMGSREAATASTAAVPGRPNVIVHSKSIGAGETSSSAVVPPKARRRTSSSAAQARTTAPTQSHSQPQPPYGFTGIKLESLMSALHERNQSQLHKSLARWKHTLSLMAKAYYKQLLGGCGDESSASILLTEMVGFSIREAQFRKRMEKFKAAQTKDLIFEVERDKHELVAQTIRQLNMHYTRRTANSAAASSQTQSTGSAGGSGIVGRGGVRLLSFWNGLSTTQSSAGNADVNNNPPLACHKVKVTFKDEPGEGSGVARSFYSAVADAFLTMQTLPDEHHVLTAFGAPSSSDNTPQSNNRGPWTRSGIRERSAVLLGNLSISGRRRGLRSRYMLSVNSQPYFSAQQPQLNESASHPDGFELIRYPTDGLAPLTLREPDRETLGERLLARVRAIRPTLCNKITGMLLDLQPHQLITILASEDLLRGHVDEAADMLLAAGLGNNSRSGDTNTTSGLGLNLEHSADVGVADSSMNKAASTPNLQGMSTTTGPDDDTLPLFYRASKCGYYTPIAGKNTAHRLNAFRNVGRMIGICLLQMEIFPLHVCRHVLKFVLGRPINWFDLAFYDPILFESMRTLVFNEGAFTRPDQINDLMLNFEVALPIEEGGGVVELVRGGSQIAVTHENVVEYIYRFVEMRLLGNHLKALEAIKQGVYDVIPFGSLTNMTSEDLRLLLCGTQEVSMTLMQSYTSFTDESSAAPDVLQRFKGWFWSVCGKLNSQEKQDLVFFWTGSPSLPSSEEGFQPLPTVLVRPADDQHLPTANTCISRLYLPLYSSKKVLRSKLLMAIKAKNFGFV
uniref:E3 ubiquitin-protein ligase n=1 Tax=Anisakis simplex TaxID=6269 RepID=A0A3G6INB9_ANISI|nr:E3 ubiquitin-protein ligase [Anisakis simplex]